MFDESVLKELISVIETENVQMKKKMSQKHHEMT
jgi:hypothetical protein